MKILLKLNVLIAVLSCLVYRLSAEDIIGCGGFIKSEVEINFSLIEVKLYTKQGSLKYQTDCAPNNGYYMVPVYDKGEFVLKVEPPPGWTFEPQSLELSIDGKTDRCSRNEDINFQFTGFGVVGKVVSKGQTSGPSGVTLTLKKSSTQEVVKEAQSVLGGDFTFERVLPGDYVVEASHPTWIFDTAKTAVHVGRETGNAGNAITVQGYDVQGQVFSDGEPVHGVNFILFTSGADIPTPPGCDATILNGAPSIAGHKPVCHVASQADGFFRLAAVPCGKYIVVPFYKGEHIKFDVVPSQLELTVEHNSVVIREPFQVAGFSVSGHVRSSKNGAGVAKATIIIDGGKFHAVTHDDGTYHLDGIKTGVYKLNVDAPRMAFNEVIVRITPNTPQLPDIVASRFKVCGQIIIDKLPEGVASQGSRSRSVKVVKLDGQMYWTGAANADGSFCTDCEPGSYLVSVELTEAEVKAGLRLAPDQKEVTVVDLPVDNIKFSQFRAKISGTVHCLEDCGQVQLALSAVGRGDDRRVTQAVEGHTHTATFTFDDVMPGKYRVSVLNELWCWTTKVLDLEVTDRDLTSADFQQSGYILSCSLTHDITLNYVESKQPSNTGSLNLTRGVNKFCLDQPGVYTLSPVSCHQFEQDVYQYDTSRPSVVALTAVRHRVDGQLTTQQRQSDIIVTIRTPAGAEPPIVLGPLKSDKEIPTPPKTPVTNETKPVVAPQPKDDPPYTYVFSHWARSGDKLEVTATSGQLLFYPHSVDVTIRGDVCPGLAIVFTGRLGVFVEGEIHPALQSVLITIAPEDAPDKKLEVHTDENGQFRVGPLDSDQKYTVDAGKSGYIFTPVDGRHGHFNSFKLGEIIVEVNDESPNPLPGVLLSLSGGSNYRRNNVTQDGGDMLFSSLSPGKYFLKPMMKEYQFEPTSQMIEVLEGTTVKLQINARRVAFSCYGSVVSLNGDAEPGIHLEAVGQGPSERCQILQEETKTDLDGTFRIRGLEPGCDYSIQLKIGDVNPHIERTAPKTRRIQVTNADLTGVHIIAFRRQTQMDISGNVITVQEHVATLKVHLYKETSLDSPLHSVTLGPTSFFYPPSIPLDNQVYLLKMTSSLPRGSYDYALPEIQFTANISHKHFTLRFDPQRKVTEQELSPSSFLILPLTILALFIGYNYQQVIPFLTRHFGSLQSQLNRSPAYVGRTPASPTIDPTQIGSDLLSDSSPSALKKKLKAKKI